MWWWTILFCVPQPSCPPLLPPPAMCLVLPALCAFAPILFPFATLYYCMCGYIPGCMYPSSIFVTFYPSQDVMPAACYFCTFPVYMPPQPLHPITLLVCLDSPSLVCFCMPVLCLPGSFPSCLLPLPPTIYYSILPCACIHPTPTYSSPLSLPTQCLLATYCSLACHLPFPHSQAHPTPWTAYHYTYSPHCHMPVWFPRTLLTYPGCHLDLYCNLLLPHLFMCLHF